MIDFQNFGFQYFSQAEPTLKDINLTINQGEKILIVGPSGSGKSTLGSCLNALIPFSYKGEIKGSLKINGVETSQAGIFQMSKTVGTVLQDSDGQFVGLTVGEDIAFALENDLVGLDEMRERVKGAAERVGVAHLLKAAPFELSGGQKQRTALAGVLVNDVDILLFDEPLANLDPATGKTAIEIIDDIHKNTGKTIIIIEHRLEDVLHRRVDRVLAVDDGRLLASMSADELISSGLLGQIGVREPLYVTALKYAGVKVTAELRPSSVGDLDIGAVKQSLLNWYNKIDFEKKENGNETVLSIKDVSFSYNGVTPNLSHISFDIKRGEMVSIVGKNGAGKTTLAKLLCGFEKNDSGVIYYKGADLAQRSIKERANAIGYVMQNPNQMISKAMIFDEAALGLRLRNVSEEEVKRRVDKALQICGLAPFSAWPVSALSYGQKKRVTIASILVLEPEIIILDEPTAGQDYKHYTDIMEFIVELNKTGVTILLITHDMHLMLEYTPRVIVIADGRIVTDSTPSDVLTDAEIIGKANLKETSLYALAHRAGIADARNFVAGFIGYERALKNR